MRLFFAVFREVRRELDRSRFVVRIATVDGHNVKTLPLGALGPLTDFLSVKILPLRGMDCINNVVDFRLDMRRVARPEQFLRSLGFAGTFDQRFAAGGVTLF